MLDLDFCNNIVVLLFYYDIHSAFEFNLLEFNLNFFGYISGLKVCMFNANFQQYFSYIMTVSFNGGENQSARKKPQTCALNGRTLIA
jgi:hypothetical protein